MAIIENYRILKQQLPEYVTLVAVSKFQPIEKIQQLYSAGHRDFGENYVQELIKKHEQLPKDIRWHFIGHLQSNKVKYLVPFIHLIQGVDSLNLLKEINKYAIKNKRVVSCLLQVHIAREETKFGLSENELWELLKSDELKFFHNIKIKGLMGMATNTNDTHQVQREFQNLKQLFEQIKKDIKSPTLDMQILSMGMSQDYNIAIQCGSNMIRLGTSIFGERKQNTK